MVQAVSCCVRQLLCVLVVHMATKEHGRPRKTPLPRCVVTIEGRELAESTTRNEYLHGSPLLTLSVPHRLLLEWHRQITCPEDYICLLNACIEGEAVVVQAGCEDVYRR